MRGLVLAPVCLGRRRGEQACAWAGGEKERRYAVVDWQLGVLFVESILDQTYARGAVVVRDGNFDAWSAGVVRDVLDA